MERPCAGRVFGGSQDAGEPRGVERRGRGPELRDVDVQTLKVLRPRDDGQGARSILRHGAVTVRQLHVVRLLERAVRRRVSVPPPRVLCQLLFVIVYNKSISA